MVAHEKNSSTDKQGNEKDFQQINKEMKNVIDKNLIKALLLLNGRGCHKNGRGAKKYFLSSPLYGGRCRLCRGPYSCCNSCKEK